MSDHENENGDLPEPPKDTNQINVQVKDSQGEVFFKIKRTTRFEKVMKAFCERQGKNPATSRFVFEGTKVLKDSTPADLEMEDGDIIEVYEEQLGGA